MLLLIKYIIIKKQIWRQSKQKNAVFHLFQNKNYYSLICFNIIAELWRAKRACGAPWISKSTHPRKFGNQTVHPLPAARPSAPQGNQCSIPQFLASLGAQEDWYCTHTAHQCCDQLTAVKTRSRWQVSPDRIAGSVVDPSRSSIFLKLSADKWLLFNCWQAQV